MHARTRRSVTARQGGACGSITVIDTTDGPEPGPTPGNGNGEDGGLAVLIPLLLVAVLAYMRYGGS